MIKWIPLLAMMFLIAIFAPGAFDCSYSEAEAYAGIHCPHPPRSGKSKAAFRKAHPCPGGADKGSTKRCRGYVIDHVCPLACCGLDAPSNMQWETIAEGKKKDQWELTCRTCR